MSYERLEQNLRRAVVVTGRPDRPMSLTERMAFYNVPGVSLAVSDGGDVAWTAGYGEASVDAPVTPETRFQAGSISKSVAAACALRLVEQGHVDLDQDVNRYLRRWQVPDHTWGGTVTLRRLLNHTAGTTVTGFPGYSVGAPLPTTTQMLAGAAPANTAPVVVDTPPGADHRYSGGGYTVVQQLVEEVTETAFEQAAQQLVLEPAGMFQSTFAQPLPGGWHVYPEKAAAGLWSTSGDLARFALALQRSAASPHGLLKTETASAMFIPQAAAYGLGVRLEGQGEDLWFYHRGGTRGYRAYLGAPVQRGYGVALMANGEDAAALLNEVLGAVLEAIGWSRSERSVVRPVMLDLTSYEGTYHYRFEAFAHTLSLYAEGGSLWATSPTLWHGEREWLPESPTRFIAPDGGVGVMFDDVGPDGVPGLLWGSYRFSKAHSVTSQDS